MFTGIVQELVTIRHVAQLADRLQVQLSLPLAAAYALGDSILLHGICSTIVAMTVDSITVEYMPETLRQTTVSHWVVGQAIHAEVPATLATKLSGSIVTGHVDAVATIVAVRNEAGDVALDIAIPEPHQHSMLQKGCVTINGVNLTIANWQNGVVTVKLVPYTLQHTTLGTLQPDQLVNIECDYIAKLIIATTERQLQLPQQA